MSKYFCAEQVLACFNRLASQKTTGKVWLERTSGLMYFLAFDAVSKRFGEACLDLHPEKTEGLNNRKALETEFASLVLLERSGGRDVQVIELGKIEEAHGTHPEKRISSNFFTVPLKKASEQVDPYDYPKRPAPLMTLGRVAAGVKWGIIRNKRWEQNLPGYFSEITGSRHFTDLAVFVFRDFPIPDEHTQKCIDAFTFLLKGRYTPELAAFWIERIKKEQLLTRHVARPSCNARESIVRNQAGQGQPLKKNTVEGLKSRVEYLERLLQKHGIDY